MSLAYCQVTFGKDLTREAIFTLLPPVDEIDQEVILPDLSNLKSE